MFTMYNYGKKRFSMFSGIHLTFLCSSKANESAQVSRWRKLSQIVLFVPEKGQGNQFYKHIRLCPSSPDIYLSMVLVWIMKRHESDSQAILLPGASYIHRLHTYVYTCLSHRWLWENKGPNRGFLPPKGWIGSRGKAHGGPGQGHTRTVAFKEWQKSTETRVEHTGITVTPEHFTHDWRTLSQEGDEKHGDSDRVPLELYGPFRSDETVLERRRTRQVTTGEMVELIVVDCG